MYSVRRRSTVQMTYNLRTFSAESRGVILSAWPRRRCPNADERGPTPYKIQSIEWPAVCSRPRNCCTRSEMYDAAGGPTLDGSAAARFLIYSADLGSSGQRDQPVGVGVECVSGQWFNPLSASSWFLERHASRAFQPSTSRSA